MGDSFWTNTIWYLLLGAVTLIELVFVMVKAKNRRLTLAFYVTILGLVLNFETIILIFLKAYTYYPKIIQNPPIPFDDVLAGNLFSQFSVATSVILIIILDLKFYWYFVFAVIYGLIEELFLASGVYSHNWYRTWMTVVLFPILVWITKKMYKEIITGINQIFYYGYIFIGQFTLNIITLTWGLMLLRLQNFSMTMLADPITSRYILAVAYSFLLSISLMFIYYARVKLIWKVLIIIIAYNIYYFAYKFNLIWIKEGWFLPIFTITIIWMYLSVVILDKLYKGKVKID